MAQGGKNKSDGEGFCSGGEAWKRYSTPISFGEEVGLKGNESVVFWRELASLICSRLVCDDMTMERMEGLSREVVRLDSEMSGSGLAIEKGKDSVVSTPTTGDDEPVMEVTTKGSGLVANVGGEDEEGEEDGIWWRESHGNDSNGMEEDERVEMEEDLGRFFRIKSGPELDLGKRGDGSLSAASSSGGERGGPGGGTRGRRSRRTRGTTKPSRPSPKGRTSPTSTTAPFCARMEEIPFWNTDHRKMVPIELQQGDARDDLALMQGKTKTKISRKTAALGTLSPKKQWLSHRAGFLLCTTCNSAVWPPHGRHHAKVCGPRKS